MQCAILAGGLATRMLPATSTMPKALLDVAGRPFADHQLAWLADEGVTDVVYCVAHLGDQIREHVGDGDRWGLRVHYADEGPRRLGTAGALRAAAAGLLDEAFLVLYGDSYLHVDVRAVWRRFLCSGMPALMTVYRNDVERERNNVRFVDGRVEAYEKHHPDPRVAGLDHIDYGLLAFRRAEIEAAVQPGAVADLSSVQHMLAAEGLVAGYEVTDRFYEIGTPDGRDELEALLDGA